MGMDKRIYSRYGRRKNQIKQERKYMLRVSQIKVVPEADLDSIKKKTASVIGVKVTDIGHFEIVKQSIDARKKPLIYYSYTVDVQLKNDANTKEAQILKRLKENQVTQIIPKAYQFPEEGKESLKYRPVIVGMGPAGLFCGYMLAKHGYAPILIERGKALEERTADVEKFWETGILDTESNVQFGEGGAGTFSDGKLNTLIKDKDGRNHEVLRIFVENGAPEKILYDAKPHIGTDVLTEVVRNMRNEIIKNGGEVHFSTKMDSLILNDKKISGICIQNNNETKEIPCENVVLALGHSARDTFYELFEQKIPMEAKAFAVGLRMEHPQSMINEAMYGMENPGTLGAAPYKVTAKASNGRGVYSFCMCPGGYVVIASSEEGRLAVNGMSYSDRGSKNANSALIVTVTPEDFGSDHPLAGIEFQKELEEKAYKAGKGKIPVQKYRDYKDSVLKDVKTADFESISDEMTPNTKGQYSYADLTGILPKECNQALVEGIEVFAHQIKGFNRPDAILLGVESRTSSPIRIIRGDNLQSDIEGLYPCGEGAGYAGGITSAAMDGIRVAEEIARRFKAFSL